MREGGLPEEMMGGNVAVEGLRDLQYVPPSGKKSSLLHLYSNNKQSTNLLLDSSSSLLAIGSVTV